jgi:hypothetical protein
MKILYSTLHSVPPFAKNRAKGWAESVFSKGWVVYSPAPSSVGRYTSPGRPGHTRCSQAKRMFR